MNEKQTRKTDNRANEDERRVRRAERGKRMVLTTNAADGDDGLARKGS